MPMDPSVAVSTKYAELYSVPKSSKYPELCVVPGQYDEMLFPVDTPNTIPTPSPAADFKQLPHPEGKGNGMAMHETLHFNEDDLDLSSLLSLSAPANDDSGSANLFESDPYDICGLQPSFEGLVPSASVDSSIPDGIHYWNGLQKDNPANVPTHQDAMADLFMTNLCGAPLEDSSNVIPMDIIPTASPATSEAYKQFDNGCDSSPKSDLTSPDSMDPSKSPGDWQRSLRDLFEQTFDQSDLEGEYMLPPPNKRQEYSPSEFQPWPLNTTTPSSPMEDSSPPQSIPTTPLQPPQDHYDKKKLAKDKPKHILLFGKDEGEIIHRLLTAKTTLQNKPVTRDKLVSMPVEEFNQLLEEAKFSEIEVAFMKEWRRRGKNKAAAQVARKRKREEVSDLDEEVHMLRQQKVELERKYDRLRSQVESLKERSLAAENKLFQKQSEVLMAPVSRSSHSIHVMDDNKLLLIPRVSSKILLVNQ